MKGMERGAAWAAIGLAVLVGCSEAPPPPEPVLRPVRTITLSPVEGVLARSFSGTARASVESTLSFRVSGTVERVGVEVGDRVRRGQEIARLDPTDLRLQVREAEAGLAQANAAQRRADADYDRVRGLYENNSAAKSDLDAARAQAESSRAQFRAGEQRLELAERQLAYSRLIAPFEGAVAAVEIEVNENVQAGGAVVMLASIAVPEVLVAIPEALIGGIEQGDTADVRFDAVPDGRFTAEVTEVGVAATGGGGTYPVTVRLEGVDSGVRPGMTAEVAFRLDRPTGSTLVLPPVAVGEDRLGRFVFVLDATAGDGTGVVRRQAVTIGAFTPDGIEVLDGLAGGERIVTAGVRRLTDGMQVKVLGGGDVGE